MSQHFIRCNSTVAVHSSIVLFAFKSKTVAAVETVRIIIIDVEPLIIISPCSCSSSYFQIDYLAPSCYLTAVVHQVQ
jgi:hypothetical protein